MLGFFRFVGLEIPRICLTMLSRSNSGSLKYVLTEEQRGMYAAEKLENFRWLSKLVATYSGYTLTDTDLVSDDIYNELAELGMTEQPAFFFLQ